MLKPATTLVAKTDQDRAGLLEETGPSGIVGRPPALEAPPPQAVPLAPRAIYQKITATDLMPMLDALALYKSSTSSLLSSISEKGELSGSIRLQVANT